MLKRSLTAFVLLAVIGVTVFYLRMFHIVFADLVIVLFALVGTYEMAKCLKKGGFSIMWIPLIISGVIIYPLTYFMAEGGILLALAVGAVASVSNLVFAREKHDLQGLAGTLMCMIYPLAIMMLMVVINHKTGNFLGIFLIFITVVLTDTMAYLVGSTVKGPKLCPNISPKKTISGAVGGLIGGMLGAVITWVCFDKFNVFSYMGDSFIKLYANGGGEYNIWVAFGIYLVIGVVASVAAMIGDLGASIIKRKLDIKDYGNIFPGHGGVMDRIDSFLFVVPIVYIVLSIITRFS